MSPELRLERRRQFFLKLAESLKGNDSGTGASLQLNLALACDYDVRCTSHAFFRLYIQ